MSKYAKFIWGKISNYVKNNLVSKIFPLFLGSNQNVKMQLNKVFGILGILTLVAFSSCKKRCSLPPDEILGDVVPGAIVKEVSSGSQQVVRSSNPENDPYRVSFDGGVTYTKVDFNQYILMSLPNYKNCHSQVIKKVTIDKTKGRVEYLVTVNECDDCEDNYSISNWVMVPKFPSSYHIFYRVERKVITKEKK